MPNNEESELNFNQKKRLEEMRKNKRMIENWLSILSDEERCIIQLHLIDGKSWRYRQVLCANSFTNLAELRLHRAEEPALNYLAAEDRESASRQQHEEGPSPSADGLTQEHSQSTQKAAIRACSCLFHRVFFFIFFYDAQGKPGMVTYNDVDYFYVYNLQGDVVALIDADGTQMVEYIYDAWGYLISKTGKMAATLGTLNPFRYRGYVYDEETGLYYLESRYYNPAWYRFVSIDCRIANIFNIINNAWAYCYNEPIYHIDSTGTAGKNSYLLNLMVMFLPILTVPLSGLRQRTAGWIHMEMYGFRKLVPELMVVSTGMFRVKEETDIIMYIPVEKFVLAKNHILTCRI